MKRTPEEHETEKSDWEKRRAAAEDARARSALRSRSTAANSRANETPRRGERPRRAR